MLNDILHAVSILKKGGIIAYPTEAVYGLGCDPFNKTTVIKLLKLKKRSIEKGLILIASAWGQIQHLTSQVPEENLNKVLATWPGPVTWAFPVANNVPEWLIGKHKSVALRVTNHPIAKAICELFEGPIISTSANVEGGAPARKAEDIPPYLLTNIDYVIEGAVGNLKNPTIICDVLSDEIIRG